ncbi:MAG: type 3 dihydrofolate reductase [Proteobacteria bacterium]|nr:MAG: type 3 dihydrofolate reductase [Pseudomonadota bacterium]QKK11307.1 MAG: type 3 dihydrofolate reductase [Pseudomonadota bacterium]
MTTLSLIAAMSRGRVIGHDNQLPWHLPADLQHFKTITMGKPILMGRLTYESIGKPLPGRRNIVITRDAGYTAPGCEVVHSIESALAAVADVEEAMVIGGASFYAQLLPQADRLYLTFIDAEFQGDAWFPQWSASEWREVERDDHAPDERNPCPYAFVVLERIAAS